MSTLSIGQSFYKIVGISEIIDYVVTEDKTFYEVCMRNKQVIELI